MNPYTTTTQARIQPHGMANVLFADPFTAAASLAALERQRGWQAEAEVDRLLRHHGVRPASAASLVAMLRQMLGAALVRVGEHLVSASQRAVAPAPAATTGGLKTAG